MSMVFENFAVKDLGASDFVSSLGNAMQPFPDRVRTSAGVSPQDRLAGDGQTETVPAKSAHRQSGRALRPNRPRKSP